LLVKKAACKSGPREKRIILDKSLELDNHISTMETYYFIAQLYCFVIFSTEKKKVRF